MAGSKMAVRIRSSIWLWITSFLQMSLLGAEGAVAVHFAYTYMDTTDVCHSPGHCPCYIGVGFTTETTFLKCYLQYNLDWQVPDQLSVMGQVSYLYHHVWKYRVVLPQSLYIATVQDSTTVVCPFCDPTVVQQTIAMQSERGASVERFAMFRVRLHTQLQYIRSWGSGECTKVSLYSGDPLQELLLY